MGSLSQTQVAAALAALLFVGTGLVAWGVGLVEHMPLVETVQRAWWRLTKRRERILAAGRARPTPTRRAVL